jgi:hypothetical protein
MNSAMILFVASAVQVLGTCMIAVEAVRLRSLLALGFSTVAGKLPQYRWTAAGIQRKDKGELWGVYGGILILLGPLLADTLIRFRDLGYIESWMSLDAYVSGLAIVDILIALPAAAVALVVLTLFGSFVLPVLAVPLLLAAFFVRTVKRNAAGGAIGVLGLVLLIAGTTIKLYLDWLGS